MTTSSAPSPPIILDASEPSICIPRTFANIRWQQVKVVFEQLFGEGNIERVDVARKTAKDGSSFNCMFVHFIAWPTDAQSQEVRRSLLDGKTIKIVYDDPWYWKCALSRVPRPEKRYLNKRPYIVNDGVEHGNVQGTDVPNHKLRQPTLRHSTLQRPTLQQPIPQRLTQQRSTPQCPSLLRASTTVIGSNGAHGTAWKPTNV